MTSQFGLLGFGMFFSLAAIAPSLPVAHAQSPVTGWLSAPIDQSQPLGNDVTFDCLVRNLGNRSVIWSMVPDDRTIDPTILFINALKFNAPDRYSSVKLSDGTGYQLAINDVGEQDDASFECTVQKFDKKSARLTVLVAPGSPLITSNGSSAKPWRENDVIQLTCSSTGGNPAPNVTWYRNGVVLPSSSVYTSSSVKFGVTSGSFVRRLTSSDDRANYTCVVQNRASYGVGVSATALLNVEYAPVITFGSFNPLIVVASSDVTLVCHVTANPSVDIGVISWFRSGSLKVNGTALSIKSVSPVDAGAYTCSAMNAVNTSSAQLVLDVQYRPRPVIDLHVDDDVTKNSTVIEGSSVALWCSSQDSNPPASAVWWSRDGALVENGGKEVLTIGIVQRTHAGRYTCFASNSLTPSGGMNSTGSGNVSVTLSVLYKPGQTTIKSNPSPAIKGDNFTMTCTVDDPGNPPATLSWQWTGDVSGGSVRTGPLLTIPNVRLTDGGNYTCSARNSLGSGTPFTTAVDVFERPEWYGDVLQSRTVVSSTNQSGVLGVTCEVTGRPVPSIDWSKDGRPIDVIDNRKYRVHKQSDYRDDLNTWLVLSTLYWQGTDRQPTEISISPLDAGNYSCTATSGLMTSPLVQNTRLVVFYPPIIVHRSELVATDLRQSATLSVVASALPPPEFTWYNGTTVIGSDMQVSITTGAVTSGGQPGSTFDSQLTVKNVSPWDLNTFKCVVRNDYGSNQTTVQLVRSSNPEVPRNFSAVTSSWESVILTWLAGFDGGRPQTFKVITYASVGRSLSSAHNDDVSVTMTTNETMLVRTGLLPSEKYEFVLCAYNSLGRSSQCVNATATTPGFVISPSQTATFDVKRSELSFTSPSGNTSTDYCVHIDVIDATGTWNNYVQCDTIGPTSTVAISPGITVNGLRTSFCLIRRQDVCSQSTVANLVFTDFSSNVSIIVGAVFGALIALLAAILVIVCCRRHHLIKNSEKSGSLSTRSSPVSSEVAVNRTVVTKVAPASASFNGHQSPQPQRMNTSPTNGNDSAVNNGLLQLDESPGCRMAHDVMPRLNDWSPPPQHHRQDADEFQRQHLAYPPRIPPSKGNHYNYSYEIDRHANHRSERDLIPAYRAPPSDQHFQTANRNSFQKPKKIIHEVIV